jgi:Spy/CpxP family protein refolding chaperone
MAKTWQVVLATIAIFLAGFVTGGSLAIGAGRWMARHPRVDPSRMFPFNQARGNLVPPSQVNPQLMKSFVEKLDLNKDQKQRIEPIVRRTVIQLTRERREVQLSSALLVEKMQDQIADILTPEQRAKFEDMISQQRARIQQFRQGLQQQQAAQQGATPPAPEPSPASK